MRLDCAMSCFTSMNNELCQKLKIQTSCIVLTAYCSDLDKPNSKSEVSHQSIGGCNIMLERITCTKLVTV